MRAAPEIVETPRLMLRRPQAGDADAIFARYGNEASPKPPSDDERSVRESSLLAGRRAAAKTASKASPEKRALFLQNTALEDV